MKRKQIILSIVALMLVVPQTVFASSHAWTIYVLGDGMVFYDVLNALASIFKGDFFGGSNAFGLGSLALIGAITTLLLISAQGIVRQELRVEKILLGLMLASALIVPKGDVQIECIYDQVAGHSSVYRVDDVPLSIAMTGHVLSTIAYEITERMETNFAPINGDYIGLYESGEKTGFNAPVKMYYMMRKAGLRINEYAPYLTKSLSQYTANCVYGRPEYKESEFRKSNDPTNYLLGLSTNGFTVIYQNDYDNEGTPCSCSKARTTLRSMIDKFVHTPVNSAGQTEADLAIQAAANRSDDASSGDAVTEQELIRHYVENISQVHNSMVYGMKQSFDKFARTLFFSNFLYDSMKCGAAPSEAERARCTANFTEALAKQVDDSAYDADFFSKMSIPAMNLMTLLFYALTPVVLAMVCLVGIGSVGTLSKFMLFGAWVHTWLPVACIINYLSQSQFYNALKQLSYQTPTTGGVTLQNLTQWTNIVSEKMVLANNLLSASPMITFAILSGSAYAMTGVIKGSMSRANVNSGFMGSMDKIDKNDDVKNLGTTLDLSKAGTGIADSTNSAMAKLQAGFSTGGTTIGQSVSTDLASNAVSFSASGVISKGQSGVTALQNTERSRMQEGVGQTVNYLMGTGQNGNISRSVGGSATQSSEELTGLAYNFLRSMGDNTNYSATEALQRAGELSTSLGAFLRTPSLSGTGVSSPVGAKVGGSGQLSSKNLESWAVAHGVNRQDVSKLTDTNSAQYKAAKAFSSSWKKAVSNNGQASRSWAEAVKHSDNYEKALSLSNTLNDTASEMNQADISATFTPIKYAMSQGRLPHGIQTLIADATQIDQTMRNSLSPEGYEKYQELVAQRQQYWDKANLNPATANFTAKMEAAYLTGKNLSGKDGVNASLATAKLTGQFSGMGNFASKTVAGGVAGLANATAKTAGVTAGIAAVAGRGITDKINGEHKVLGNKVDAMTNMDIPTGKAPTSSQEVKNAAAEARAKPFIKYNTDDSYGKYVATKDAVSSGINGAMATKIRRTFNFFDPDDVPNIPKVPASPSSMNTGNSMPVDNGGPNSPSSYQQQLNQAMGVGAAGNLLATSGNIPAGGLNTPASPSSMNTGNSMPVDNGGNSFPETSVPEFTSSIADNMRNGGRG
ncbi:MAG: conjugal transfer protein TraG N-terminal domain-containing protein, partial [Dissulfuribacterales bacterium]